VPDDPFPTLKPGFRHEGNAILSPAGDTLARVAPGERRLAWDFARLGASPELQRMAEAEARQWDEWTQARQGRFGVPKNPAGLNLARWLRRFPEFAEVLAAVDLPLDLGGKTILNVGGTGQDLVYWLGEQPGHIDHVEVSPRSQAWCARKVEAFEEQAGERVPIAFHTVPAEHLPFADGAFDFVFARSTIHHCVRPGVLDELHRVLRPGGVLLFSEFFLNDAFHALAMADRKLRRRDRGTDDPLRPREIDYCETLFEASGGRAARTYRAPLYSAFAPRFRSRRAHVWSALKVVFAGVK